MSLTHLLPHQSGLQLLSRSGKAKPTVQCHRPSIKVRPWKVLLACSFALLTMQVHGKASQLQLEPTKEQAKTIVKIVDNLTTAHFKRQELNDAFSEKILEHYLETLDPLKLHFTQEDLVHYRAFNHKFDNAVKNGDLTIPFIIFNRYHQRATQRYKYLLQTLKSIEKFDFSKDTTIITDRRDEAWPADQKALEKLWDEQLVEAALRLVLADKTNSEAKSALKKRFKAKLGHLRQTTAEDGFQAFANSVTELFDPHTQYLSPRASDNFNINMSLSLEGIGAVLQTEDELTKVIRLVPGGPAEKSGKIKPLDKIVAVGPDVDNLTDVIGWRIEDVVSLIRGPKGTDVYLELIPADTASKGHNTIKITRNTVKLEDQAVRSDLLKIERSQESYNLGVVQVPAFYSDFSGRSKGQPNYRRVSEDMEETVNKLKDQDIDGLVIDLRGNGGGSLEEANRMVGLFIPTGPTVQIKNTSDQVSLNRDSDPKIIFEKPIVVVIDRLSASASEIFAGAIQDYQRGLIVGSQSFGKGTVQVLRKLDHGQLKLTHAKFYRISGESNQHQGIIPDIAMISQFNPNDVGESALDNALPWDTIKPADFKPFYKLRSYLPTLKQSHRQRLEANPNYTFLIEQNILVEQLRDQKQLSLNRDTRLAEQRSANDAQLKLENARRIAQDRKPYENYKEFESMESKKMESDQDNLIRSDDAVLLEAGEILADLIQLNRNKRLQANLNTGKEPSLFDYIGEMLE